MANSIAEIAAALEAESFGDARIEVTSLAEPADAESDQLAVALSANYAADLPLGKARAAVLWPGADWQSYGLEAAIVLPRPRYAMAGLTSFFADQFRPPPGIHETAIIDPGAQLGDGVSVGPYCVIGAGVVIGANANIADHVSIGADVRIGDRANIMAGVRIRERVHIGSDFICQPGVVIGGDGFSFVTPEKSRMEEARESLSSEYSATPQSWVRIHSLGTVEIGDNVELGANCTIDRGTVRATRIGSGTKLDSSVQVGHNVDIGRDCLLCAHVGIGGSTVIGDRVVLGGQVGVVDNIQIGDDVVVGAASKILSTVPPGAAMLGYPAVKMDAHVDIYKVMRRLPRLARDVKALQKSVSKLEEND